MGATGPRAIMQPARTGAICLLAAGLLAGCGVSVDSAGDSSAGASAGAPAKPALPTRAPGVAALDSGSESQLTPNMTAGFAAGSSVSVQVASVSDTQAFRDLCAGRVDIVDAARAITSAEAGACASSGLQPTAAIVVASDALVIATKNEADVGGDCLAVNQVADIYRAGSPLTNWNQLGFFSLPLRVTGRAPSTALDDAFVTQVFGLDRTAQAADFRSDLIVAGSDDQERAEVTGSSLLAAGVRQLSTRTRTLSGRLAAERRAFVNRAVAAADRRALREIAAVNRSNRIRRVRVDAAALAIHNRRLDAQAKASAAAAAGRQFDAEIAAQGSTASSTLLDRARQPGVVGFFAFAYYTNYESQLRPMEIAPAGQAGGPRCIFPSATTVSDGSYPLARRLRLYATRQSLARPEVSAFLVYYLQHAQTVALTSGLQPIDDAIRDDGLTTVTGTRPAHPTTASTGPSSPSPTRTAPPAASPSGVPGVAPAGSG